MSPNREMAPLAQHRYHAFVDPAGGSGDDSMTLAIGHIDHAKQVVVIDAIREARPPFSPETVITGDFASLRSHDA